MSNKRTVFPCVYETEAMMPMANLMPKTCIFSGFQRFNLFLGFVYEYMHHNTGEYGICS